MTSSPNHNNPHSLSHHVHEYRLHTSKMVNFDTPQLKAVKNLLDAYASLDLNNVEPLISKNHHHESLPASTDLPKQSKEDHLQVWKGVFSSVNKFEVRIRHRRTSPKLSD
jgi:hypothetical protein